MTQYQQAKRDGQLTADSQAIPLIVRSGTAAGPEVLGQNRGNRRLRQRHQGRRHRDPLAGQGLPAVRFQVPVRPRLARVQGPLPAAWATPAAFSQGLYNPATWTTDFAAAPKYKDGATAANGAVDKSATPGDWVTVNRLPEKAANGEAVDQTQRKPVDERSYRENLETGKKLATPLAMVYGTFDAAKVKEAAGDVNRLPLGGYDPAPFTLTKDASGQGRQHRTQALAERHGTGQPVRRSHHRLLRPRRRPRLRAERQRDRRRPVRAKVPGSWKQAQPEVEKLANEIRDMGLQATVVAGSAREDASIAVPGYSKDDAGKESPLGTVPAVVGPPGRRGRRRPAR